MAKSKAVQLQVDITNDDEWEKFLQRDGLLVVDVYSEWCGPCLAMQGNLKKIKLESGGDFLSLGMARSNQIEDLHRFANKSEPTWMFIAQGQQVGLLFGSNAPELQRMILDEMKNERDCLEGKRARPQRLPSDLSDQEQHVFQASIKQKQERERIKIEKQNKQMKDRSIAQAKNILDTMAHLGLIIIFPHAARKGIDVIEEFLPHTGLAISKKERPQLTEEAVNDIEFLSPSKMPAEVRKHLTIDRPLAVMLTVDQEMNPGPVDDSVLRFVYGESKQPPGEPETPGFALLKSQIAKRAQDELDAAKAKEMAEIAELAAEEDDKEPDEEEEVEDEGMGEEEEEQEPEENELLPAMSGFPGGGGMFDPVQSLSTLDAGADEEEEEAEEEEELLEVDYDLWGIWAPANDLVKATALMHCFPLITSALILPDVEPTPPHLAIAFDVFKKHDVYKLMDEYDNEIMAYGFFSSDQPDEATLIAKTKKSYEKKFTGTNFGEKLVIKIAKKKSDPILAFAQLGPTYMSSNVESGEKDCALFFPENYDDEEPEPTQSAAAVEMEDETEVVGDYQDMVFEGVLQGAPDEDLGDLAEEVEEIPPVRMSELPEVEDEEEEDMGQLEQPPPPPMPSVSKMKAKSMSSKMAMKSSSKMAAKSASRMKAASKTQAAPPPEDGEEGAEGEGQGPPPAEGEGAPPTEEAPPGEEGKPAEEATGEGEPPAEEAPPAEDAPPAEEAPPAEGPPPEQEEEEG